MLVAIWLFSAKFKLKKARVKSESEESEDRCMKNYTILSYKWHNPTTIIGASKV